MRTNVRCRKCQARKVLTKHPDEYTRLPKCNTCGNKNYRVVIREKQETCNCSGYWFPHRKGSNAECSLIDTGNFMEGLIDTNK